jgi:hypothetical protein
MGLGIMDFMGTESFTVLTFRFAVLRLRIPSACRGSVFMCWVLGGSVMFRDSVHLRFGSRFAEEG